MRTRLVPDLLNRVPLYTEAGAFRVVVGLAAAVAGALLTLAVRLVGLGTFTALLISLAVIAICVVVIANGGMSTFDPVLPAALFVIGLYGARPAYDMLGGRLSWVNVDVSSTYISAIALTAVFIFAYLFSYLALRSKYALSSLSLRLDHKSAAMIRRLSWPLGVLGLSGLALTVAISGGLSAFINARTEGGQVDTVAALQYILMLGIAASLFRVACFLGTQEGQRYKGDLILASVYALPIAAVTGAQGSRRYILPLAVGLIFVYYLADRRPLPVFRMSLVACGALFLILLPAEDVRAGGQHEGDSFSVGVSRVLASPDTAAEALLESQSTSMVPAFAMQIGDMSASRISFGYGQYTLAETILQPVPQQLWPDKPDSIRNVLIANRYGLGDVGCESLCPTFGPLSTFYADGGALGVAVGGVLLGALTAGWTRLCARYGPYGAIAFASTMWGFAYVWWSSVGALTLMLIFFGAPMIALGWWARRSGVEC